ncbi:MAG: hypothetical protein GVY24_04370 [Planctomycetes bacterium]|jgi:hypothetical protein|nr:hypothetical protein [Planctomycetota bacterium]
MVEHPNEARRRALAYLQGERQIVGDLGSGTDGWVFSLEPYSVIKVHATEHRFQNELRAYLRLREDGVTAIGAFSVPDLRAFDAERLILEISFVTPPYLIDFGKSMVDREPDFPPEHWEDWWRKIEVTFEENASMASYIFHQLRRKHGILHLDLNPYNLNFGDDI